jgi:hypothetical protein
MTPHVRDTISWHGQRLTIRSAEPQDVPRIVQLHHALVGKTPHPNLVDDPVAWFLLGGPWMHEYYCERHLRAYHDLGFDVWIVVAEIDEFIGTVELWYDSEPEPFGQYGHMELRELMEDVFVDEVEDWIILKAERRAFERGFRCFWCNPHCSGGSPHILRRRGYQELWPNGQVSLTNLDQFQPPPHRIEQLRGDYEAEAAHLLALNHREAAGFRWRYLWRTVLDPEWADWPTSTRLWAGRVTFLEGGGGICLVTVWLWFSNPPEARIDLWVHPDRVADVQNTQGLLSVAVPQAVELGATSATVAVPWTLAGELATLNVQYDELSTDDSWYRKTLAGAC